MHSSSAQTLLDLSELFTRTLWRQLVTASCVLFAGTMIIRHYRRADLKHTIPSFPGPKGLPLLGNIHQLEDKQWLKYTEWHRIFGPIFSLNFAGQPVLVVGNASMAADLMERRSAIYSDRPRFIMATEILTGGMNLAFARWGDRWKRMRKAANIGLSNAASQEYTPMQEKEAIHLLHGLMDGKSTVDAQIRRTSASTVLSAVYAYPLLESTSDPCVVQVESYVDRMLKAALPGNYFVDIFPWMMHIPQWIPGARWKREGFEWFKKDTDMFQQLVEDTHMEQQRGTRGECFIGKLLENAAEHDLDPVETAWLAGTMFGAGTEALAATLSFFILAMVLYPRIQHKLRDEIDAVVGAPSGEFDNTKANFPTFQDTKNMPYLHAVIKEVMRWRPMGPMGVPHRSVQDDVYDGHFISAGTLIISNVWAMHQDSSVYQNPEQFIPERFLAEDTITAVQFPDTKGLGHHGYGFGRRMCIGYHVANNSLAINAANIIWAFQICKAKDALGNEITPDPDALLDEGLAVRPMPFNCTMTPRSPSVAEMISVAARRVF